VNVDITGNPGYSEHLGISIAQSLLRNVDKLRRARVEIKKKWLDPRILLLEGAEPVAETPRDEQQLQQVQTI